MNELGAGAAAEAANSLDLNVKVLSIDAKLYQFRALRKITKPVSQGEQWMIREAADAVSPTGRHGSENC